MRRQARHGFLAEALLELRDLAPSGSEEMGIIDEALGKAGIYPWKVNPECKGRGEVCMAHQECGHCRQALCGMIEYDGNCEICIKCSLHCECGTFDGNDDDDDE